MNPFTEIFWAQLALVVFGALLQLVAFCAFARDPQVHSGLQPDLREGDDFDPIEKATLSSGPQPFKNYFPHIEHRPDENISNLRPAQLAKTKKVSFKQKFQGLR